MEKIKYNSNLLQVAKYSKNRWFRFICFVQIFLLLVTTIGLSIDIHYCQGKVKSIGFFANAEECGIEHEQKHCDNSQEEQLSKKPCCQNFSCYFHSEELANKEAIVSSPDEFSVTIFNPGVTVFEYPKLIKSTTLLVGKAPPLKGIDFTILYNTFLL